MIRSIFTASLLSALLLGIPASGLAQDPDPAPAPDPAPTPAPAPSAPPPPDRAVPRSERPVREPSERVITREPSERTVVRDPVAPREVASPTSGREGSATSNVRDGSTANSDQGERRGAVRRPPPGGDSGGQGGNSQGGDRAATSARDRAVAHTGPPPDRDNDRNRQRVYIYPDYWSYGRYSPYYYGNYGFELGYLAYSPWGWTPAFYGSPYGYGYGYGDPGGAYRAQGYATGAVKVKVSPRDAEVYVDGYFAGHVDDFDGLAQSLKLDSGAYRIEIRKPGFDTLQFDVRVQPGRTITYRGEMRE